MELYRLIADINNTATTFTFDFIPENFEGVKIGQSFSFVNPIGYTPKYSIDTMRIIASDKSTLDTVFLQYGLESDVIILIQKLNATGTGYENVSTFAIDFESYEIFDDYSEFALKSVSVIDYYNNVKNTEKQYTLASEATLPNTQKFINYVSLKSIGHIGVSPDKYIFKFEKNNESKIYDSDTSLLDLTGDDNTTIYMIGLDESSLNDIIIDFSIKSNLVISSGISQNYVIELRKSNSTTDSVVLTISSGSLIAGNNSIDVNLFQNLNLGICYPNDFLYINIIFSTSYFSISYDGSMFIDIKKVTDILVVNSVTEKIKYISVTDVLNDIFNNNISYFDQLNFYDFGLTSANQISKLNDFANVKPKEFLSDFCVATGSILNFKKAGGVVIASITNYFNSLLTIGNAVVITNFKDLSVRHNMDLNFASVEAGQEISTYDIYSYLIDWNKKLTFKQSGRNAVENLDLTLQKLRIDFSGMLDYFYKRSKQQQKTSKDNFIFDPNFVNRHNDIGIGLYDYFTPRDILYNWNKFLSFCFQNYSKNTLIISSNGGTPDNLSIDYVAQMDNIVLNSTPRLLPIEYNFTCLIDDIDFSEKILKINDNGEDVYLFVIKAETIDNFSEQKIQGLKIQF